MLAILDLLALMIGVGLVAAPSRSPSRAAALETSGGLFLVAALIGLGTLVAQAGR